jgi:UDP:flavonoid glycosyltransferase YjiC (YdhE family)
VLAARSLNVPSACVGAGFALPPGGRPLPPLRDWDPAPPARLLDAEARLLDSSNRVLAACGGPPLALACDLLLGDTPLLCTWPELDPWRRTPDDIRWFGPNVGTAAGLTPRWPAGTGARVFAYLGAAHPGHGALLAALVRAGCRVLCYQPDVAAGGAAPFAHPRVAWAPGPVNLDAALADAAFAVCHAGESTVSQALLAGCPLLMLPPAAEPFLTARRVRELGAGINVNELPQPPDWDGIVGRMLGDAGMRVAAQAFAGRYADFDREGQAHAVVRALESLAA